MDYYNLSNFLAVITNQYRDSTITPNHFSSDMTNVQQTHPFDGRDSKLTKDMVE